MTEYRNESQWSQLCQRGRAQSDQLYRRAERKYTPFLNCGRVLCARSHVCVTYICHLLEEPDPNVHALMHMHSCLHKNALECVRPFPRLLLSRLNI